MKRKTTSKKPAAKRGRPRKSTRKPASKSGFWINILGILLVELPQSLHCSGCFKPALSGNL